MKLLRLLPVYFSGGIGFCAELFFKNEKAIIILSGLWAATVTVIEAVYKNSTGKNFQFYTFLCSSDEPENPFIAKMVVYLLLYVIAYLLTYSVNEKLNFRFQYNILLAMYYSPPLAEIFSQNFDSGNSSVILVYYTSLLSNLLASFTMFSIYFIYPDEEDYFALDAFDELYVGNLDYILK